MAWTAFNYQKPGTKIWIESNERKIISDIWDSQIYSQKARKSRRQGESRRPRDLQEVSRNTSLPDKTQQTGHLQSSQRIVQNHGCLSRDMDISLS